MSGSRKLYEAFGLVFIDEQHGSGPKHCSATLAGGLVIEIYAAKESIPTEKTRLGFVVDDLATTLAGALAAGAIEVSVDAPRASSKISRRAANRAAAGERLTRTYPWMWRLGASNRVATATLMKRSSRSNRRTGSTGSTQGPRSQSAIGAVELVKAAGSWTATVAL